MKLILLISLLLICLSIKGQSFCKTIGDSSNDIGYCILNTEDRNFIIAGMRDSVGTGSYNMFILKVDSTGNTIWSKAIGGAVGNGDVARSIVQNNDGGYTIAGYTQSYGQGSTDLYIVRVDSIGSLMWTRTVGGVGADAGFGIAKTSDGGFIVVGELWAEGYIIKLDSLGILVWTKTLGGSQQDCFYSIINTSDGGFAVGGYTRSFGMGSADSYIIKLDSTGNITWISVIGDINTNLTRSIIETSDHGFAAIGESANISTFENDIYLIKLDSLGNLTWAKTYNSGISSEYAQSIIQISDNGFIVVGSTNNFGLGSYDIFILRLDSVGIPIWTADIGGTDFESSNCIIKTLDGGYVISGSTSSFGVYASELLLVKLDSSGSGCCINNIGSFITTTSPSVKTAGGTLGSYGLSSSGGNISPVNDIVTTLCYSNSIEDSYALLTFSVNPNPFSNTTILNSEIVFNEATFTIYNTLGQEVKRIENVSESTITINRDNLLNGLYVGRLTQMNKLIGTVKLVITD